MLELLDQQQKLTANQWKIFARRDDSATCSISSTFT